ncbi:hypothetical protein CDAR_619061, partial [Caerostris darwini]
MARDSGIMSCAKNALIEAPGMDSVTFLKCRHRRDAVAV